MTGTENQAEATKTPQAPRRKLGRKTAGSAGVAVVLALGLLWWFGGTGFLVGGNNRSERSLQPSSADLAVNRSVASRKADTVGTSGTEPASKEQDLARNILGEWEQINKGKRLLTVREDGTATMKVSLDGAWSYVVGEKLEFEIEWKIEGERLLFHMTSGKPEGSMKVITSLYGNDRNHRIDELTEERMILVDEMDDSRDNWKRIASTEAAAKH